MPTIGNLDAGTQAEVNAVDALVAMENAAADKTFKATVTQALTSLLRPTLLAAVATGDVTATACFLLDDPALPAPPNRFVTLPQLRELVHARTGQILKLQPIAKVGATAGWTVGGGAVNTGKIATMAAGGTGSTLVIPIQGLKLGTIITALTLNGSIQSAGNAATLTWNLRKLTNAAAGAADASVIALAALVDVVANTKVDVANGSRSGIAYTVVADESLYLLVTSTTAAATTQEIVSIDLTVTTL